jgi:hypothetical protein
MIRVWATLVGFALIFSVGAFEVGVVGAVNPPLPQGYGLASGYLRDAGIASNPAVIFADDFESYSGASGLISKWSTASQSSNVRIATEPGNFYSGTKALEFTIPVTSTETGYYVSKFLSPERDVLFLRAYAKYGDTFNVVGSSHNGITMQAHYCCPGVPANGSNKFYVGWETARFDTSTPIPGPFALYMYHPLQRDLYGDHFFSTGVVSPFTNTPFDFGPDFIPRPNVVPERGRWYAFELMVRTNTPGLKDGRIALWLDGNLIADFTGLRLRDTTALKMDKFTLELHVNRNNLAVAKKWYDNVVAATSYIGPMATSGAPRAPVNVRIIR